MPGIDQFFAVIISRLRRVDQTCGRIAIHTGFAPHHTHSARLGRLKIGGDRSRRGGAKAGHGGCAMTEGNVEIAAGNFGGVIRICQTYFLWKRIAVQPVNQSLAPAGDNGGLRIMHMRIDKARNDEIRTVIDDFGLRMGLAERRARANFSNFTSLQQNSSISPVPSYVWPGRLERVACET